MKEQFKTCGRVKTFQVSEFLYDKISLEDVFPKDMPDDECYDEIEERIVRQARRKYPHLFDPFISNIEHTPEFAMMAENRQAFKKIMNGANSQPSTHEEIRIGDIENDIRSCTELKVLETYRFIAKSKPEFQKAYDEVYAKLSNQ